MEGDFQIPESPPKKKKKIIPKNEIPNHGPNDQDENCYEEFLSLPTQDSQNTPVQHQAYPFKCEPKDPAGMDFTEDVTELNTFSINGSNYSHITPPEEIEKLKEFQVLDELKSNDEDSDDGSSGSDEKSDGIHEEDIEKMLEEDLPQEYRGAPKPKEKPYVTKQKVVLEDKGSNQFEVLPLDWMMVRHHSGMPVYLHRPTRVCTLAKPYFIGKGKSRTHEIPISAIPCLSYRRGLEEEEKQKEIDRRINEKIKSGAWKKNLQNASPNPIYNTKIKAGTPKTPSDIINIAPSQPKIKIEGKSPVQLDEITSQSTEEKCPFNAYGQEQGQNNSDCEVEINCDKAKLCQYVGNNLQELDNTDEKKPIFNNEMTDNNKGESSKSLEEKEMDSIEDDLDKAAEPVVLPGGIVMAPPRVEAVDTSWKSQLLTPDQVNEYCQKLFKFKTINILHFVRWADRHKYAKARQAMQQHPALPSGTKLITIPAAPQTEEAKGALGLLGKGGKRDWVMNMNGRSYLSVFHEYVRRALDQQPVYEFTQLENAATPYQATVYIGGMQYGVGQGSSKRAAKANAARESIAILIPHMKLDVNQTDETDNSFFDYIDIEDPRITDFCSATCEPAPHAILRTCLLRNFGAGERHIQIEVKKLEFQRIELTMRVGKHTATVACKNKKTAKQRASQAILQALHPHVKSWGSLLRLYGSRSVKSCKEKKLEEQQITLLQDKAQHNEPNFAVLKKLKQEMERLRERDGSVVPIGTLLIKNDLPTHSGSNLNNVDL